MILQRLSWSKKIVGAILGLSLLSSLVLFGIQRVLFSRNFTSVMGVVAAVSVLLALLAARAILRPLHRCLQAVKRLADQDFARKCDVTGSDEVGQMAAAVNVSMDAMERAITAERTRAEEMRNKVDHYRQLVQRSDAKRNSPHLGRN